MSINSCECQHGSRECELNQLMNCVIDRLPRPSDHMLMLGCIQGSKQIYKELIKFDTVWTSLCYFDYGMKYSRKLRWFGIKTSDWSMFSRPLFEWMVGVLNSILRKEKTMYQWKLGFGTVLGHKKVVDCFMLLGKGCQPSLQASNQFLCTDFVKIKWDNLLGNFLKNGDDFIFKLPPYLILLLAFILKIFSNEPAMKMLN